MDDTENLEKIKEGSLTENAELLIGTNRKLQQEIIIRKKIEIELNNTKNFLNTILEHIPNPIFVRDASSLKFTYINQAVTDQLGYTQEDFINKTVGEVYSKELADYYTRRDMEILKTRENFDIEEDVFLSKDNRIRIHNTKKILILDENNNPQYIMDLAEDVTDKIRNRQELRRVDQYFNKLFNLTQTAVLIVNVTDKSIIDINPKFLSMTEYAKSELINQDIEELNIWSEHDDIIHLIENGSKNGKIIGKRINLKSKSGVFIDTIVNVDFLSFEAESPLMIFVFLDITKIVEADKKAREAQKLEASYSTLKNRFISMISHEYRTPLSSMMLSADLIKKYVENFNKDEIFKHLLRIQNTILSMTKLIENIMLISSLLDEEYEFKGEEINFEKLCTELSENIETNYSDDKHVVIDSHLQDTNYFADGNLIGLIISHLLTNSLKYSYKDSFVNLDLSETEDMLIIKIIDFGIGIPQKDRELIYDIFHRGSNTSSIPGYGIGLSIVKKCVDIYKGQIDFSTEQGEGTVFTVMLPKIKKI